MRSRRTVLIIDEEPITLWTLTTILERAGYGVLPTSNSANAMEQFRSHWIDVVLMDYAPEIGEWVGPELKKLKPRVPILVLSGHPSAENATAFADAVAAKPEHPNILLGKLSSLLEKVSRKSPAARKTASS